MPYAVNDGAILEVTLKGRANGQVCMSVFHYKLTDTLGIPDGDAAITSLNTEMNDLLDFFGAYQACCSTEYGFEQFVYQWIYPTRYHRVIKTPSQDSGIVTAPLLPQNCAAAITKTSDLAGRRGVGTLHMPGVPTTFHDEGFVTVLGKAKYDALHFYLIKKYLTDTLVPVLYNRNAPSSSRAVTGCTTRDEIRVERRRTVGLGI